MPDIMPICLTGARPSIYFVNTSEGLRQGYDLSLQNSGPAAKAVVNMSWGGGAFQCEPVRVPSGEASIRVFVPDIRSATEFCFMLGRSSVSVAHSPQRHWIVHIIQFSHHDLGYTDLPSNVLPEMSGYLNDALRFCTETDSYPEDSRFRFTIEQGWSLRHFMQNRPPEVLSEMARRLREGRIEVNAICGNQITELHGPEEMARMLYPVFQMRRRWGFPVTTAEHNDIPGLSWGVAQALSAAGVRYFAPGLPDYFRWGHSFRTFWDEQSVVPGDRPHAFWWEAPDGSRVLVWYGREGAGGPIDVRLPHIPDYLNRLEEKGYPYDVVRCQVRGGDRDNSNTRAGFAHTCRQWNEKWAYPRLVCSLNSIFFPQLEAQLAADTPVWRGELPGTDYSVGATCTAHPSSLNRTAHDTLLAAERVASAASEAAGAVYPGQAIEEAYWSTLMNDEHCWGLAHPTGPGQEACLAQHNEHAFRAAALAHDVLVKSVNEMADQIRIENDGYHAVVFNPLNWARSGLAAAPVKPMEPCARPLHPHPDGPQDPEDPGALLYNYPLKGRRLMEIPRDLLENGIRVVDAATGEEVPHQIYEVPSADAPVAYAPVRFAMSKHDPAEKTEVRFFARDVPPMGCRVYRFEPAASPARSAAAAGSVLENGFYRIEIDPQSGRVCSIYDKETGVEIVDTDAAYGMGQLVLRSSLTSETSTTHQATIAGGESGPVLSSVMVRTSADGYPCVTQEITLHEHEKRIDFCTRLLKDASAHLETFFAFPFAIDDPRFRYEGSLCEIEPFKDQFPGSNTDYYAMQHWAQVSGGEWAGTLVSVDAPMVQFGGLWPLYVSQAHHGVTPPNFDHAFHGPEEVRKGHLYTLALVNNFRTNFSAVQSGDMLFRFSITTSSGDLDSARARDFGYGVCLPLVHAAVNRPRQGTLSPGASFCTISDPSVLLLTIKRAEDGRGLIVRLLETQGRPTSARIDLPATSIVGAVETNLVEEDKGPLEHTDRSVLIELRPLATATLRVYTEAGR